jgi:uncharacterized membrane protein
LNPRSFPLWRVLLYLVGALIFYPILTLVNLFNQPAIQAQGVTNVSNEVFITLLLFIGAVLAGVLFVLDRTNRRLADSLPPQLLPLLKVALDALATLADQTPTELDDELIQRLKDALNPPTPLSVVKPDTFPEAG